MNGSKRRAVGYVENLRIPAELDRDVPRQPADGKRLSRFQIDEAIVQRKFDAALMNEEKLDSGGVLRRRKPNDGLAANLLKHHLQLTLFGQQGGDCFVFLRRRA
ncbi:hypothetical protein SDC9_181205 [bioreactor metagenome]|uniref:Uncharacterized protein n=1 Tax=bioreactor metagenome TaxID=1076179 RepID=A0A645HCA0_9ZZZZ